MKLSQLTVKTVAIVLFLLSFSTLANVTDTFSKSNEKDTNTIDHGPWQQLLEKYLVDNHSSGINLFAYGKVTKEDRKALTSYLAYLKDLDPREYRKSVQQAYWINLYNALTVDLILENYPVKSITKLGESLFTFGPWGDDAITVANEVLSLNDIEHKILRPIWQDPRIHYAVNCASIGCPNLSSRAFTSLNTEELLNQGARSYVNHSRGVQVNSKELMVSSIYHWYLEDFGNSHISLITHLKQYANPKLKAQLEALESGDFNFEHHYDWQLNEHK